MDHETHPDPHGSFSPFHPSELSNDVEHPILRSDESYQPSATPHFGTNEDMKLAESTSAHFLSSNSDNFQPESQAPTVSETCVDASTEIQGERCVASTGTSLEAGDNPINADAFDIDAESCPKARELVNPDIAVVSSAENIPVVAALHHDDCVTLHPEANAETELETSLDSLEKTHSEAMESISDAGLVSKESCPKACELVNPDIAMASPAEIIPADVALHYDDCITLHPEANVETELQTSLDSLEKTRSETMESISDVGLVLMDSLNEETESAAKELPADKLNAEICFVPVNDEETFESENKISETRREDDQAAIINLDIVDNQQALSGSQSDDDGRKLITNTFTETNKSEGGKLELESTNKLDDEEIKNEINISSLDFSLKKICLLDDTEVDKVIDQVSVTPDNNGCLSSRVTASSPDVADIGKSPSLGSEIPHQCGNPINTKYLTPKHYKGKKKRGNDFKMESNPQHRHSRENEALSSVVQVRHGHNKEKDGGSSLDSTAGTGWKTKESNDQTGTEDVNSSGGEDSASSPACLQPSQQRKKINIHHQFVREIVKIQHDREQYDKEQVERQIQVQQSGGLVQLRNKNPESKESKSKLELQHIANDSQSVQKPMNSHSNETASQQKHNVRSKRSSSHQTNKLVKPPLNASDPQKEDVLGKGIRRSGRGKQRAATIYRPPVARESVPGVSEEQNVADIADCSYSRSAADVNNSSDGSTGSVSESTLPAVETSSLLKDEGRLKVVKSSSGERFVHFIESQAESTVPEMNIKVIFDTQRKLRHIELSEPRDGQDSATDHQQNSNVGFRSSRSSASLHGRQDSVLPNPPVINKKQMLGLSKGNDQSNKVSWSESCFPVDSPKFQDRAREGKGAQLENPHKSSWAFQKDSAHFSSVISGDSQTTRFTDTPVSGVKMSSSLLQGFSGSSSGNFSSHKIEPFSHLSNNLLQSMDALTLSMDVKTAMQTLQPNHMESRTDMRGKQKTVSSTSSGRKKRESHSRIKESRSQSLALESPLKAQGEMKVGKESRSQSLAPYQVPDEIEVGFQGLSIHMDDVAAHQNMESSQSDMSWNTTLPGLQSQMNPLPSKDNIFSSLPVSGKWGDIVDEFPDYNDYSQMKRVGEQEDNPISSIQSGFGFAIQQGNTADKRFYRENSGNKGLKAQDVNFDRSKTLAYEVAKETPSNGTPTRKSVWERLGPQNDKGSILGPPPKMSDNWNVLKPSPQFNTQKAHTSSSLLGGIDAAVLHESLEHNAGSVSLDDGLEVVVQAYTDMKQKRSKRELYVPRRGL